MVQYNREMKLLFCGDVMPGGVLHYQENFLTEDFLNYLQNFDLRVATFECSVGSEIPFDKKKMERADGKNIVFACDEDIDKLNDLKLDVVTLANNHIFDQGEQGLKNTITHLDRMGIKHCGAGMNLSEAKKPAVVKVDRKSIAFIGCSFVRTYPIVVEAATSTTAGIYQTTIEDLIANVKMCKQEYDFVFVLPHWGREYEYLPTPEYKKWAQAIIDSGADGVIGSHPHQIQPHYRYHKKFIYFSLGNFLFPDICMQVPRPMFYPKTKEEVLSLKKVWAYPNNLKEPVLAIWPGRSRIGMIAEVTLAGHKMKTKTRLTCMNADNILGFYDCPNSKVKNIRMLVFSYFAKSKYYDFYFRLYHTRKNFIRKLVHIISDKWHIKYDVDVSID